ncbi:MAG: hypothetical protein KDA67_14120 [Rhodobacteraceae bacterium]|nr:hypothetical protein [Paracoccaceae bacterium]
MQPKLITIAALSMLAMPAVAAPLETPYALSAIHADFQAQLGQLAQMPGSIGIAASQASTIMTAHNAAQERLILPLLGLADATSAGQRPPFAAIPDRMQLEAELTQLFDGDVDLVTALAELYAAADKAGEPEIARLAERMIWHETGDVEVLYPTALLIGSALQALPVGLEPASIQIGPGPLYGEQPVPMVGTGKPHGTGTGN